MEARSAGGRRKAGAHVAAALVVALMVALNAVSLAREPRNLDLRPLAAYLLAHGTQAVFVDYWQANRLTFETGEHLAGVAIGADLTVGPYRNRNRYPPYLARARAATRVAWVVPLGAGEAALRHLLARRQANAVRAAWGPFAVYTDVTPPVRPADLAEGGQR
jgi:hypothetical protein